MASNYEQYMTELDNLPEQNWTWNLYGAGVENIGKNNKAESFDVPKPATDQMLVRVDAVSLCFSDVKVITQGRKHPKLYNRDLTVEPTRLGHETSVTIVEVGDELKDQYKAGDRYAMQPDIYQNGKSTAYGYTIPGGLVQYHLIGKEILETDTGPGLLKLNSQMGIAESALLEPWGCVWASYTQRRRLTPKKNGIMWVIGQPGDDANFGFSKYLDQPAVVVLTDVPEATAELIKKKCTNVAVRNNIAEGNYDTLIDEFTGGMGFDDIVVLNPHSAAQVSAIATHIARRGTMNLIGTKPLDGLVDSDVGRLHYDYIAFIGNNGTDIADSYGEARNRCDLEKNGTAVFVGAGGPMGQMHVQRAIEMKDGPSKIVVTDINDQRLSEVAARFEPLTKANNRELYTYNPTTASGSLHDLVMDVTTNKGAEDVVVCVPNGPIMGDSATFMSDNGMLVLFSGVPNGTLAPLDLSKVYLHNAQYTGTSGLTIEDQIEVMDNAVNGNIAPAVCVAAIGGIHEAQEGYKALIDAKYPGKILIFPQLVNLPLMGLDELQEKLPSVAEKLSEGNIWTIEAEKALFDAAAQGLV